MPYPVIVAALITVSVITAAVAQSVQNNGSVVPEQTPKEPYGLSTQPASTGNPVSMSPTAARKEGTVPSTAPVGTAPAKN